MTLKELLSRSSLKSIGREIGLDVQLVEGHLVCTPLDPDDPRYSMDFVMPSMKMVSACRADDFDFFQPFIAAGMLTIEQMHHAAQRYHLGKTRSGQPMYWMIDDRLQPLDAHIGQDLWISQLLKKREPLLQHWQMHHCLFGLHLISNTDYSNSPLSQSSSPSIRLPVKSVYPSNLSIRQDIAIVESEEAAVILSEFFPEQVWLATVYPANFTLDLLEPLRGHTVTLFPHTDPTMDSYLFWLETAKMARSTYQLDIMVSDVLEQHATEEQKARNIDLVDFLFEASKRPE